MKKTYLFLIAALSLTIFSFNYSLESSYHIEKYSPSPPRSGGAANQGLGDRTGSPLSAGSTCSTCHGGGSFSTTMSAVVKNGGGTVVTSYTPGQNYTIEYTVAAGVGSPSGYGMQSVLMSPSAGNAQAGTLTSVITSGTQLSSSGGYNFLEHSTPSSTGVFSVNWTAPSVGFGNVNIYAAGLAVNGNGGTSGDHSSAAYSLTITEACSPTTGTDTQVACGSFDWIDGITYTASNSTATHTLVNSNAAGCDSTVTLNLTINTATTGTDTQIACGSFDWIDGITYTASNSTATHTLVNSNTAGCDSTVTLNLTINTVDVSVTNADPVLTAGAGSATYQWIDCDNNNSFVASATNQSFTPLTNGNYAVIVTENNCADTSVCYSVSTVSIEEKSLTNEILIQPNPTNQNITLNLGKRYNNIEIKIINPVGQTVLIEDFKSQQVLNIDLLGENGIYYIVIQTEENRITRKVVKK